MLVTLLASDVTANFASIICTQSKIELASATVMSLCPMASGFTADRNAARKAVTAKTAKDVTAVTAKLVA